MSMSSQPKLDFEAEIGFGLARQLFEPTLRAGSAKERRRLVDGVARGAAVAGAEPTVAAVATAPLPAFRNVRREIDWATAPPFVMWANLLR